MPPTTCSGRSAASPRSPFRYKNKGSLATIGRSAAVADLGKIKLSGPMAWMAWLVLHLMFLVGFRNRLVVIFEWAWSFVSYDRGARLITGPLRRESDQSRADRQSTYSSAEAAYSPAVAEGTVGLRPTASVEPQRP